MWGVAGAFERCWSVLGGGAGALGGVAGAFGRYWSIWGGSGGASGGCWSVWGRGAEAVRGMLEHLRDARRPFAVCTCPSACAAAELNSQAGGATGSQDRMCVHPRGCMCNVCSGPHGMSHGAAGTPRPPAHLEKVADRAGRPAGWDGQNPPLPPLPPQRSGSCECVISPQCLDQGQK